MDQVEIKHPRPHNTGAKAVPLTFVAGGTASGGVARVAGHLTGQGTDLHRHPVAWVLRGGKFHWLMVFKVNSPGSYDLAVTGFDNLGSPVAQDSVAFKTKGVFGPTVDYPSPNQDITADKDYFIAYGVPSSDVVDATMTPTGGSAQHAASVVSDTTNNPPFWAAQFDPLGAATYFLDVRDTTMAHTQVAGLTVT
jgi:hypothetical protein